MLETLLTNQNEDLFLLECPKNVETFAFYLLLLCHFCSLKFDFVFVSLMDDNNVLLTLAEVRRVVKRQRILLPFFVKLPK